MFDVHVTEEQKQYAADMVKKYNFGQRGYGDGSKKEQLTGIIGQTVLADLLGLARPNGESGFDHGVDFVINGKKVDIKTMSRTVPMKDHYVHNFIGYQRNYTVDYYIFASYNTKTDVLSLCGYVTKAEFQARARFYNKGEMRYRDDGTGFPAKAPLYEIKQSDLNRADSLQTLISGIQ